MKLRERLGDAIFLRVAGPDGPRHRERIHFTPGPRWFEPHSPITRVHGDASMFVGGIRALLLQTLHPAAMTAVAEHSGFRGDLWGRLHRTSTFLAVTTFGTSSDATAAVSAVRAIHERVNGTMPDGTPYAASDPHLLRWVHVAEADSFLLAHQVYGRSPLSAAECDEYVAQVATVGARLGVVDPPLTLTDLRSSLSSYRPELRGTDHARDAVSFLLREPPLPLPARPAYGVLMRAAVDLLPPWARSELGLGAPRLARPLGAAAVQTIRWAMFPSSPAANAAGTAVAAVQAHP